jgi:hypothetical protein
MRPAQNLALVVATAIGAVALPVWRPGIGWLLAGLAITAAIVVARSGADGGGAGPTAAHPGRVADLVWRGCAAVAALAFLTMSFIRAAGWVVAICVVTSIVLASYALAGGRTWLGLVRGATALLPGTIRGLGWAAGDLRERGRPSNAGRVLVGIVAGALLLLIFGGLFRSADPAFAELVHGWSRAVSVEELIRGGIGATVVGLVAIGAAFLARHQRTEPVIERTRRILGLVEWVIPLTLLDLLFGVFVWVQITVLFGGKAYVLGPGGPDYADYARLGFAQLGLVTLLTLAVVATVVLLSGRRTNLELGLVRLLVGVLCGLTLVVVASALKRLTLYAEAYGFTPPRLLAYTGEAWLGLVFVLLLVAGVRLHAPWLPRATAAAAVVALLTLAAINPEAVMARTLLGRLGTEFPVDYAYLSNLSTDAIDVLDHVNDASRDCVLTRMDLKLRTTDPWYEFNLSRQHARDVLVARPTRRECWAPDATFGP